jgi:hypothetical protein
MKKLSFHRGAAAAMLTLFAAASAHAVALGPVGPFTANGEIIVSHGQTGACRAKLVGTVEEDGRVTVTSASFAGVSKLCVKYSAQMLPWTFYPISKTELALSGMVIGTPEDTCAVDTVATWNNRTSKFNFDVSDGVCRVAGAFVTTPALSVQ